LYIVGQQMRHRVIAGDDGCERRSKGGGQLAQVGDGKRNVEIATLGLRSGACDGGGRQIGGGDVVTKLRESERLRADATRRIENTRVRRDSKLLEDRGDASTLPRDARLSTPIEEVVERSQLVVERLCHLCLDP
jgi:hypothetical protein